MSGLIFPTFAGEKFTTRRSPTFNVHTQKALSGKESRISYRAYPLIEWELEIEWLPDNQLPNGAARVNYLQYSQDITASGWSTAHGGTGFAPALLADQAIAPDGTLTGDQAVLYLFNGVTSGDFSQVLYANANLQPGTYTDSVYLKTMDGTTVTVNIQWLFGAGGSGGNTNVTVTPNWQRFIFTGTVAAIPYTNGGGFNIRLQGNLSTSTYANLAVWGGQIEPGLVATPYIRTNGVPVRQSDLKTMIGFFTQMLGTWDTFLWQDPQFNTVTLQQFATGDGTTTKFNLTATDQPNAEIAAYLVGALGGSGNALPASGLGGTSEWVQNTNGTPDIYTTRYAGPELLSSGSRTNLALQSAFGGATWAVANGTLTANAVAGPDGTTDAATFNEGTATGTHNLIQQPITIVAGAYYTFSVFLKYNTMPNVNLVMDDNANNGFSVNFNVQNGTMAASALAGGGTNGAKFVSASIVPFGTSGWYRCTITGTIGSVATGLRVAIVGTNVTTSGFFVSYTGTSRILDAWGAQVETGLLPTALIPTTTATATNGGSDYSLTNSTTVGTSVVTFQQVQFGTAPANNVALLWSGSFFYRNRFSDLQLDFEEFMSNHWAVRKIAMEQIIL